MTKLETVIAKSTLALGVQFALLMCVIGCGGASQVPVYSVKGVLKIDGKPVPDVEIQLQPVEAKPDSLIAMGRSNKDGKFSMAASNGKQGAAKGKYKVVLAQSSSEEQQVAVAYGKDNPQAWMEQQKKYMTQKPPNSKKSSEDKKKSVVPEEFTKKETSPRTIEVIDKPLELELDL